MAGADAFLRPNEVRFTYTRRACGAIACAAWMSMSLSPAGFRFSGPICGSGAGAAGSPKRAS